MSLVPCCKSTERGERLVISGERTFLISSRKCVGKIRVQSSFAKQGGGIFNYIRTLRIYDILISKSMNLAISSVYVYGLILKCNYS